MTLVRGVTITLNGSGLKYDLFKRNRYLDLNYPSLNFKVIRNVIPSLKSVKFKNVIE